MNPRRRLRVVSNYGNRFHPLSAIIKKSILKSGLVLLLWQAVALQAATTATNIAAGGEHTLFIKSDGSLWGMGLNNSGQLDRGTIMPETNRPVQIVSSGGGAIAAGEFHSLFLRSDGRLWAMGRNSEGELGDGTTTDRHLLVQIVSSNVIAIAAGNVHSLFLKSDGSLWAMGWNVTGQLGDGTTTVYTNRPEQIVSSDVIAIAAGNAHSLFLKNNSSLWAMGRNSEGELGDETTNNINTPEQIVSSGVTAIAAGGFHSLFLKSNGSLWGMGANVYGQLGDGTTNNISSPEQIVSSNVVAITAGDNYSFFLKSDGSLWAMGWNYYGQLGDGTTNNVDTPEQIVSSGVIAIASGEASVHSLFLKSDGSFWAMGYNGYGQLGDGFTNNMSLFPEQILPLPQPVLMCGISSGTNLQFNATCQFGGTFYLLVSTYLTQSLSQWMPVWTNSIHARVNNNFTATLTNAVSSSPEQRFYILQSQ
jgi:alpha-tubulin suppressor-like RCC1 family protein